MNCIVVVATLLSLLFVIEFILFVGLKDLLQFLRLIAVQLNQG